MVGMLYIPNLELIRYGMCRLLAALPRMEGACAGRSEKANMDRITTIYAGVGVATCALALVGRALQQRSRARARSNEALLNFMLQGQYFMLQGQSAGPGPQPRRGSVPDARRPTGERAQISGLEARLRSAILSADARERLIKEALNHTAGGDRAAAIRKVLSDLEAEHNRWS